MRICATICLLLVICVRTAAADDGAPGAVPFVEEAATRASYEQDAMSAKRILEQAYELSPSEVEILELELTRMVEAQTKYDIVIRTAARDAQLSMEAASAKNGPGWEPTQEDLARFMVPLMDAYSKAPFSMEKAQGFIESKLPAERVKSGRARVETVGADEAWKEYDEQNSGALKSAIDAAQHRNDLNEHRKTDGDISPAGNPMPKAEFVPPAPPPPPPGAVKVQPPVVPAAPAPSKPRPVLPETPRNEPAVRVEPPTPPAPPLQPAPPLDEWDRHVDAVAQKYKFTSDQKSKGQGILKDIRDRARQYRKSHSADFEAASRMQAGADRIAEEKRLAQPLDELFAELKERLEHLPTQDQRDAAGVKPKK